MQQDKLRDHLGHYPFGARFSVKIAEINCTFVLPARNVVVRSLNVLE